MDVSVIVPCYNEALNIPTLLGRLSSAMSGVSFTPTAQRIGASVVATPLTWEVVLVDDASSDDTGAVMSNCAKNFPISAQRHEKNQGMVAGWVTGCAAARGRIVVVMDADLQYAPEDVPRLLEELECTGADLSQGYRAETIEHRPLRKFLSVVLSATLNFSFGTRLYDAKSNFFACRREVLADLLTLRGRYRYFSIFFQWPRLPKAIASRKFL